jgi:hypothetical protein
VNADPLALLAAVPGALADDAARGHVRDAAGVLPASSGGGFECHLGDPGRVDLSVRLDGYGPLGAPFLTWLERDAGAAATGRYDGVPAGPHRTRPPALPGPDGWVRAAAEVRGAALPRAAEARLRGCLAGLPGGAWPTWVGALPGRDGDVRLTANGLTAATLATYLAGFPSDVVAGAVALAATVPAVAVHLDVGAELGPAVGVEVVVSPRRTATLAAALLAGAGRDPAPAAAVTRWPGVTVVAGVRVVRRVNHLKVVLRPGEPPRPKAYLYYGALGGAA